MAENKHSGYQQREKKRSKTAVKLRGSREVKDLGPGGKVKKFTTTQRYSALTEDEKAERAKKKK